MIHMILSCKDLPPKRYHRHFCAHIRPLLASLHSSAGMGSLTPEARRPMLSALKQYSSTLLAPCSEVSSRP